MGPLAGFHYAPGMEDTSPEDRQESIKALKVNLSLQDQVNHILWDWKNQLGWLQKHTWYILDHLEDDKVPEELRKEMLPSLIMGRKKPQQTTYLSD